MTGSRATNSARALGAERSRSRDFGREQTGRDQPRSVLTSSYDTVGDRPRSRRVRAAGAGSQVPVVGGGARRRLAAHDEMAGRRLLHDSGPTQLEGDAHDMMAYR